MSTDLKSNIVLIGMPGAGKSTAGVILAKMTNRHFVDTDLVIQGTEGRSLQDIVDRDGYMVLREIEERVIRSLDCGNTVIATGGSAVYGALAMAHLKRNGTVVFLDVSLATIMARVADFGTRGLAKRVDQSIDDLFVERHCLYVEYADVAVNVDRLTHEAVCWEIIEQVMVDT